MTEKSTTAWAPFVKDGKRLVVPAQSLKVGDMHNIVEFLGKHPEVTEVDLSKNNIGVDGARMLSECSNLQRLTLSRCDVGPEGAAALAQSKSLKQLQLDFNKLGDDGARALARSQSIIAVNVWHTDMGVEGTSALDEMLVRNRQRMGGKQNEMKVSHNEEKFADKVKPRETSGIADGGVTIKR